MVNCRVTHSLECHLVALIILVLDKKFVDAKTSCLLHLVMLFSHESLRLSRLKVLYSTKNFGLTWAGNMKATPNLAKAKKASKIHTLYAMWRRGRSLILCHQRLIFSATLAFGACPLGLALVCLVWVLICLLPKLETTCSLLETEACVAFLCKNAAT